MKIAFAIKGLGGAGGGAERVLTTVASGLADRGHDVSVITSDRVGVMPYYSVSENVQLVQLGIGEVTRKSRSIDLVRRFWGYRRKILELQPHVVIAFMHPTYLPVGLAMVRVGIPVVASEHTTAAHYRKRPARNLLLQLTPTVCAAIAVVSEQVRRSFGWWMRRKMVVEPNPVLMPEMLEPNTRPPSGKKILLAVGVLRPEKQHDVLISAFAEIAHDFPDWNLRIVGGGEKQAALEAQILSLDLTNRVELPGACRDVFSEYEAAELFVVPSSYESFGLAAAEALMCGLPAVGFAECPGVNEIIRDGENGKLVRGDDPVRALAGVLAEMMASPTERHRLADSPRDWIDRKYGLDAVLDSWESLIGSITR